MIPRAHFGATGHESSRTIFGAAALGNVSKGDADRALDLLLEHGVNHIDVAASYGDAELRIATWLRQNPHTFFVATKTGQRTYREAREEGLVRFIGVTGHGLSVPEMHRRSLERFPFDSVLAPYNFAQMRDPRYAETFEALAAVCKERNVALQTIKSIAWRRWEGRSKTASTWYEPLREQADIDRAVHWVLGRPEAFLLTTGDVEILPMLLDAAERYERRPSNDEMEQLLAGRSVSPLFV
jgi:aryl-alcohol dehydrogenase-like predicted oxidoreductase